MNRDAEVLEVPLTDADTTPLVTHTGQSERARGPRGGKPACRAQKVDGGACGAPPTSSGWCTQHDPGRRDEVARARQRGGQRTAALVARAQEYGLDISPDVSTPAGIRNVIEQAIHGVASGRLSATAGGVVAQLARVAVEVAAQEREVSLEELLRQANAIAEGQRR
jgi:hypothetical protein